ncbi:E3 ubiquitin-protein ligase rad18 [Tulasnella sp. 332]|nr:E3 ubiquitin-protein ligase rad18 [Tulasnella sp. 332]
MSNLQRHYKSTCALDDRQSILDVIELASRPIQHTLPSPSPRTAGKRKWHSTEAAVEYMSDVEEMEERDWQATGSTSKPDWTVKHHRPRASSQRVSSSDTRVSKSKGVDTRVGGDADNEDNDVGMIECPQCAELVEYIDINEHLDNGCVTPSSAPSRRKRIKTVGTGDGGEGKRAWQNIFNGTASSSKKSNNAKNSNHASRSASPPVRLPREAYDTLKDKQLRERLSRFDLATTGTRAKLQARHERWTVVYNANLDQDESHRKSLNALRAALVKWEEGRERDEKERAKAIESSAAAGDSGAVGKEYEAKHQSHFQLLIEQARASKAKPLNLQPKAVDDVDSAS